MSFLGGGYSFLGCFCHGSQRKTTTEVSIAILKQTRHTQIIISEVAKWLKFLTGALDHLLLVLVLLTGLPNHQGLRPGHGHGSHLGLCLCFFFFLGGGGGWVGWIKEKSKRQAPLLLTHHHFHAFECLKNEGASRENLVT